MNKIVLIETNSSILLQFCLCLIEEQHLRFQLTKQNIFLLSIKNYVYVESIWKQFFLVHCKSQICSFISSFSTCLRMSLLCEGINTILHCFKRVLQTHCLKILLNLCKCLFLQCFNHLPWQCACSTLNHLAIMW